MPAKKVSQQGPQRTSPPRDLKPPYSCDNAPVPPLGLEEVLRLIKKRWQFAYFIRNLLCTATSEGPGAQEAQACLEKWYKPVTWELEELCFPSPRAKMLACTDQNLLIQVAAYTYGGPVGKLRFSFGPRPAQPRAKKKAAGGGKKSAAASKRKSR